MSIVNIKERMTSDPEIFNTSSFSDQSYILTDAIKEKSDQFSFELHAGNGWATKYSPEQTQLIDIPEEGVTIPSRGSVVVEVEERIKIPHNLYGVILPTGSLFLSKGILIAPAKIEPSFHGKLKLRLFNTTAEPHKLRKGDKLASALFLHTEITMFNREINKGSEIAQIPDTRRRKFGRWFASNKNTAIGWAITIACSSGISSAAMYFAYYQHVLNKPTDRPSSLVDSELQIKTIVDKYLMEKKGSPRAKHR